MGATVARGEVRVLERPRILNDSHPASVQIESRPLKIPIDSNYILVSHNNSNNSVIRYVKPRNKCRRLETFRLFRPVFLSVIFQTFSNALTGDYSRFSSLLRSFRALENFVKSRLYIRRIVSLPLCSNFEPAPTLPRSLSFFQFYFFRLSRHAISFAPVTYESRVKDKRRYFQSRHTDFLP